MKVKLLTFHFSDNYGALMQAYALRQWFIREVGAAEFLTYQPRHVEEGGAFETSLRRSSWRKNVTILYMRLNHLRLKLFGDRTQARAFEEFRRNHLGIRGPRRLAGEELVGDMEDCDLLVCGSDQIWAPSVQYGLDPVYFLNFPGAAYVRRISYAASFGRAELDPIWADKASKLISDLDGVSVREASGANIIRHIAGREAVVAPDPTILLGDFGALLVEDAEPDGSVFCYALRSDAIVREAAHVTAGKLGGHVISPRNSRQRWSDIGKGIAPGPVDWLRQLVRSEVVVSNSFHGVALSIIHNKPFLAASLPGAKSSLNVRTLNLLESTGLMDRFITEADLDRVPALLDRPINWDAVNGSLAKQRKTAETYLRHEMLAADRMA